MQFLQALKKVHSQIQALQTRKGSSEGQDDTNLQQLCQEYRRIMATGKHVTVTTAHHPPQIVSNSQVFVFIMLEF